MHKNPIEAIMPEWGENFMCNMEHEMKTNYRTLNIL